MRNQTLVPTGREPREWHANAEVRREHLVIDLEIAKLTQRRAELALRGFDLETESMDQAEDLRDAAVPAGGTWRTRRRRVLALDVDQARIAVGHAEIEIDAHDYEESSRQQKHAAHNARNLSPGADSMRPAVGPGFAGAVDAASSGLAMTEGRYPATGQAFADGSIEKL